MPIYIYETIPTDGSEPERFEVMQRMAESALAEHPETGMPVRRVITAPALALKHSSARERNVLSDSNVAKHGFTKYERSGKGAYERTAGNRGPKRIG